MNYDVWQNGYPTSVTHRKYFDFSSQDSLCLTGRVSHWSSSNGKLLSDVRKFHCKVARFVL